MNTLNHTPFTPVIITGAASGIGRACAHALAEVGRPVALWDLAGAEVAALAAALRTEHGANTFALSVDVADPAQIHSAVLRSRDALGAFGGLIHAAGVSGVGDLGQLTADSWDRVQAINLRAQVLIVQALLDDMKSQSGSAIVGIASINATLGHRANPAYSASKGGLLAMSRALADELADGGIRINTVSPGQIDTPMLRAALDANPGLEQAMASRILLRRLGRPEEIARVVRFLMSDEASYVTAAELIVDGGNVSSQRV